MRDDAAVYDASVVSRLRAAGCVFAEDEAAVLLAAARYDIINHEISQTQLGVGYIDDCLILAANYVAEYAYNSNKTFNQTIMMQIGLRTLASSSASGSPTGGIQ